MINKYYLSLISTIFIVCSFFVWYFYEKNEHINQENKIINAKYQINLKKTKNKLEIENPNKNIDLYLNWEQVSSWTYTVNN